jgi:hypothetical protein
MAGERIPVLVCFEKRAEAPSATGQWPPNGWPTAPARWRSSPKQCEAMPGLNDHRGIGGPAAADGGTRRGRGSRLPALQCRRAQLW